MVVCNLRHYREVCPHCLVAACIRRRYQEVCLRLVAACIRHREVCLRLVVACIRHREVCSRLAAVYISVAEIPVAADDTRAADSSSAAASHKLGGHTWAVAGGSKDAGSRTHCGSATRYG